MSIAAMTGIAQVGKSPQRITKVAPKAIWLIPERLSCTTKTPSAFAVWRFVSRVSIC